MLPFMAVVKTRNDIFCFHSGVPNAEILNIISECPGLPWFRFLT